VQITAIADAEPMLGRDVRVGDRILTGRGWSAPITHFKPLPASLWPGWNWDRVAFAGDIGIGPIAPDDVLDTRRIVPVFVHPPHPGCFGEECSAVEFNCPQCGPESFGDWCAVTETGAPSATCFGCNGWVAGRWLDGTAR
jgi:hypothetical protein